MLVETDRTTSCGHATDLSSQRVATPYLVVAMDCGRPAVATGARLMLGQLQRVTLGRGEAEDATYEAQPDGPSRVEIPDGSLRGDHCTLFWDDGDWHIADLGSTICTHVNGAPVVQRQPLDDGDVITIGRTILVYRWPAEYAAVDDEFATYADIARHTSPLPVTYSPEWYGSLSFLKHAADGTMPLDLASEFGTETLEVARAIHAGSGRPGAFVAIEPGELREDRVLSILCSARQGTLFIDQSVATAGVDASCLFHLFSLHKRDLNALDVRILTASDRTRPLEGTTNAMRIGSMLGSPSFPLPPLRERIEDLGLIVADILQALDAADMTIEPAAATALFRQRWRRNRQTVKGLLDYAVAIASDRVITLDMLEPCLRGLAPGWRASPRPMGRPGRPVAAPKVRPRPFCAVIDHEGQRSIDRATYDRVVAERREYDLFLDLTDTTSRGRCAASRRDADGNAEVMSLEGSCAAVLAEIIERRGPLRPQDVECIDVMHPYRVFKRARQKLDIPLGRYEWRSFHTLRDGGTRRIVFSPPADLRFVVLRPLD